MSTTTRWGVGTLRVHAGTKWETSLYRNEFGRLLFDAIDAFPNLARYTLDPLRTQGRSSLRCDDVPGLRQVTLTEVRLRWPGRYEELEIRRANDLFAALQHRKVRLADQPKLVRATFAIRFRGSVIPRPLVLHPPNVAQYGRDEDAALVDEWLAARRFLLGGREAGDAPRKVRESA